MLFFVSFFLFASAHRCSSSTLTFGKTIVEEVEDQLGRGACNATIEFEACPSARKGVLTISSGSSVLYPTELDRYFHKREQILPILRKRMCNLDRVHLVLCNRIPGCVHLARISAATHTRRPFLL